LCPAFEFGDWTCGNSDKRPDDTVISQFFSGLVCGQECGFVAHVMDGQELQGEKESNMPLHHGS
jgi:hypothetical protein